MNRRCLLQHRDERVGLRLLAAGRRHYRGVAGRQCHGHDHVVLVDARLDQAGVNDGRRSAADGDRRERGERQRSGGRDLRDSSNKVVWPPALAVAGVLLDAANANE